MCGLVGAAGTLTFKHEKYFKLALILDTLRGIDSTGAAIIKADGTVRVAKKLGHAYELLESGAFTNAMRGMQHRAYIGHNRFATQGAVNAGNAHPYEFESVVGAHNGTLKNKWDLGKDHNWHAVDSYCLYSHLNEHGPEMTIPLLQGAWALTWYNTNTDTLHMIRNKERPLFIAYEEGDKSLLWASEPWMITVAAEKAEIKIQRPVEITEDTLYSWNIDEKGGLTEHARLELKGKETPFHYSQNGGSKSGAQQNQSVTPTGKVVTFPVQQQQGTFTPTVGTGFKTGYSGTKDVRMEVVGEGLDGHGAKYLCLFDPENPTIQLRLFVPHSTDYSKYDGRIVIGTIGKYQFKVGDVRNGYYKIEYSTHKLERQDVKVECKNHHGEIVDQEEWTEQFGTCQWCTSNIFPDDVGYRFIHTIGNEVGAVCSDCVEDEEVGKYVRFI